MEGGARSAESIRDAAGAGHGGRAERLRRRAGTAVAGVAVAVIAFLLLFGLAFCVELFMASQRRSQVPLPPPTSRWVAWPLLLAAALVALRFIRDVHFVNRDVDFDLRYLAAATVGLLVSLLFHDYGFHDDRFVGCVTTASSYDRHWRNQHQGCDRAYPVADRSLPDRDTLLAAGGRACDWLRAQRWGEPPRQPYPAGYHGYSYGGPRDSLFLSYKRELEASGLTRQEELLDEQVAVTAWFNLCPFQGWIHNQVGGGGD